MQLSKQGLSARSTRHDEPHGRHSPRPLAAHAGSGGAELLQGLRPASAPRVPWREVRCDEARIFGAFAAARHAEAGPSARCQGWLALLLAPARRQERCGGLGAANPGPGQPVFALGR